MTLKNLYELDIETVLFTDNVYGRDKIYTISIFRQ